MSTVLNFNSFGRAGKPTDLHRRPVQALQRRIPLTCDAYRKCPPTSGVPHVDTKGANEHSFGRFACIDLFLSLLSGCPDSDLCQHLLTQLGVVTSRHQTCGLMSGHIMHSLNNGSDGAAIKPMMTAESLVNW